MSQREPMDAAEICVGRGAPMLKAADPDMHALLFGDPTVPAPSGILHGSRDGVQTLMGMPIVEVDAVAGVDGITFGDMSEYIVPVRVIVDEEGK